MTGSTLDLAAAPVMPRVRRRKLKPLRIAIFLFLLMAALFFCVPLYVILVTAFKPMDARP